MNENNNNELSASLRRRRFILGKLKEKQEVTYKQIRKLGDDLQNAEGNFNTSNQSIKSDVDYLENLLQIKIGKYRNARGQITLFADNTHTLNRKQRREAIGAEAKLAMAWMAGSIGLAFKSSVSSDSIQPLTQQNESWDSVGENLKQWENLAEPKDIIKRLKNNEGILKKLEKNWELINRRFAVDTGTSVDAFCSEVVSNVKLPARNVGFSSLEILTNSRSVFSNLGIPKVDPLTIIVGGVQADKSEAISGHLAEMFIENCGLTWSHSFVGATSVDTNKGYFGADLHRDGIIKSKLLEKTTGVRTILAESRKFSDDSQKSYEPFCKISSEYVDIIITEKEPEDKSFREKIENSGVALLVVPTKLLDKAKETIKNRPKYLDTSLEPEDKE